MCISSGIRGYSINRPATATIEMALLLPFLMILVLGCVDFGRFAYTYIAVTNSARAAAGFASVNPYTTATYLNWQFQTRQAAIAELSALDGFDPSQISTEITGISESTGLWRAEVTVTYPFSTIVNWPGIPASFTLRRQVIMRGTR